MLRNNRQRARNARLVFLLLFLVSGGLVVLSIVAQIRPDWEGAATGESSSLTSLLYVAVGLGSILLLVFSALSYVFLILWLRRAYYNLHQLPDVNPDYSDGWAAGAWFVPFLNFVRPFTIMREVWQYTQRSAWGRIVQPATILGWWWAAFVVKLLIGRITWRMGSDGSSITGADLTAILLDAGAQFVVAGLTWHVIGQAAHFEEGLAMRQEVEKLGQPAPSPESFQPADQADYTLEEGY